jgi:hypothetical protein
MPHHTKDTVAILGIDIGKNTFHLVGLASTNVVPSFCARIPRAANSKRGLPTYHPASSAWKLASAPTRDPGACSEGSCLRAVDDIGAGDVFSKGRDFGAWLLTDFSCNAPPVHTCGSQASRAQERYRNRASAHPSAPGLS